MGPPANVHPSYTSSSGTPIASSDVLLGHHGTAAATPVSSITSATMTTTTSVSPTHGSVSGGVGGGGGGKAQRRSSGKSSHSRSYPRGVGLDFRKLAGLTLVSYIDHHGVSVRPEAPPSELAVAVARHFEQLDVDEEDCIGGFLERLEQSSAGRNYASISTICASAAAAAAAAMANATTTTTNNSGGSSSSAATATSATGGVGIIMTDYARATAYFDGRTPPASVRKRKRNKWAARPGEQVAAKVTRTDENGSWILASVQRFYADTETYDVQDEDDTSKLIRLPWSHVMRLSTGSEGCFQKGADCMAIFPETTSFYKAKVSKSPVWKLLESSSSSGGSGSTTHRSSSHTNSSSGTTNSTTAATSTSFGSSSHGTSGGANGTGAGATTSSSTTTNNSSHHHHHSSSGGGGIPTVKEIIVKFEDDEDSQGKTPHRRVPSRYVIPIPLQYFYDESDDVDLTPPESK